MAEQTLEPDRHLAVSRIRKLRDQLNNGFRAINAQADAVLFEFGPTRKRKLEIRSEVWRWIPSLRTLLLVQVSFAQYRLQKPLETMPEDMATAHREFEQEVARVMHAMADLVNGKGAEEGLDIQASARDCESGSAALFTDRPEHFDTRLRCREPGRDHHIDSRRALRGHPKRF